MGLLCEQVNGKDVSLSQNNLSNLRLIRRQEGRCHLISHPHPPPSCQSLTSTSTSTTTTTRIKPCSPATLGSSGLRRRRSRTRIGTTPAATSEKSCRSCRTRRPSRRPPTGQPTGPPTAPQLINREKEKTADQCLRIATDERAGHVAASSPLPPIKTTLEKPDKKAKTGDRNERGVDGLGSEASVTKIRLVLNTPISPYRHRGVCSAVVQFMWSNNKKCSVNFVKFGEISLISPSSSKNRRAQRPRAVSL